MATTTFDNLITFSRGSNATVTGPNGLIQWAPSNLVTDSETLDSASWLKLAAGTGVIPVVTANVGVAPDGTTTADRVQLDRGAGTTASDISRLVNATVPLLPANVGMLSVWLRSFDGVSTYAVGLTNGSASSTVTVTGVWQRFSLASISSTANAQVRLQGDITQQTADLLVWGAQIEPGPTVTTYNNTSVRNLLGFSEAFDNASWTKARVSIVTGAQANPVNGLFNAQKLMEDTSASISHLVYRSLGLSGVPCVISIYAKPSGRNWFTIATDTANTRVFFNVATGTLGTIGSAVTATITAVGNGWYRCAIYGTFSGNVYFGTAPADNTVSYTGDGNSGVYIYGAQLSNSASLDPYVPTPGAAPSSTAYYGPRFDYDPVTRLPRGLLVEEQRTNLVLRSEQFDNASWTKSSYTVSADAGVAPDGTTTADQITTTGGNGSITQTITVTASTNYVFSFYARKGTAANAKYSVYNNSGAADIIASTNYPAEFATGAWVRITVPFTTPVGCTSINVYTHRDTASAGTTLVWGAQLEVGTFATSYIPTIASTVTRSADVATITGSLFSQWYNQNEGAVIADFATFVPSASFNASTPIAMSINDNTTNNRIDIFNGGVTTYTRINIGVGGVSQAVLDTVPAISSGKASAAYAVNNFASSVAGGAVVTDNSGSLPVVSQLQLGALTTAARLNGWLRSFRYVPVRAADFQLQALTAPPELLSSNIYDRFNDLVLDRAGQTIEVR